MGKYKIASIIIGVILMLLLCLNHYQSNQPEEITPTIAEKTTFDLTEDGNAKDGGLESDPTVVERLNEQVAEGMMNISMNSNPTFVDGVGNVNIVNAVENYNPQVVEIYYGLEQIYQSGVIPVGSSVASAELAVDLPQGDYDCTAYIDGLRPDGKAQVSVEYHGDQPVRVSAIVLSCQHDEDVDFYELCNALREDVIEPSIWEVPMDERTQILINPSGRFVEGGFEADTGLTGRKLMVDTYGGLAPHGGGALSGKDGTKVDRSGAYMARYIAKNLVAGRLADRCTVTLAYAIGKAEPVAVDIDTHGTGKYDKCLLECAVHTLFDLTPDGMMETLKLDHPIFAQFCNYGHFTHEDAPWEQTDLGDIVAEYCFKKERGTSGR